MAICYVHRHTEKPILILSSLIRNMHVHCRARSLQTLVRCVRAIFRTTYINLCVYMYSVFIFYTNTREIARINKLICLPLRLCVCCMSHDDTIHFCDTFPGICGYIFVQIIRNVLPNVYY